MSGARLTALLVGGLLNPFQSILLTCPWSFSQYVVETDSEKANHWLIQQVSGKARSRTPVFWLPGVSDPLADSVLTTVPCRATANSFALLLNLKQNGNKRTLLNTYLSAIRSF